MGWTVTSTSEQLGTGDTGVPAPGLKIFFTMDGGQEGSVFVPDNVVMQGQDAVKARIAARAAALAGIKGLTG
jgi:hypothetical protein